MSVSISPSPSVSISISMSMSMSISIYLNLNLNLSLSLSPSIYLNLSQSISISRSLSTHLSLSLSVSIYECKFSQYQCSPTGHWPTLNEGANPMTGSEATSSRIGRNGSENRGTKSTGETWPSRHREAATLFLFSHFSRSGRMARLFHNWSLSMVKPQKFGSLQ